MASHRDDDARSVLSARSARSARSFKSALGRSASVASSERSEQVGLSVTKSAKPLAGTGAALDLPEDFFVDPDREEREEERRKIISDEIWAASEDAKHVEFAWPGNRPPPQGNHRARGIGLQ